MEADSKMDRETGDREEETARAGLRKRGRRREAER